MIQCNLGKTWKTHSPRYPKNKFPEDFLALRFLHLISNGLDEVNINSMCRLWLSYEFLFSVFSEGTKPFD